MLLVETILTAIVVDQAGLDVDVQTQFKVYGGYFGVMAVLFTVYVCVYVGSVANIQKLEVARQRPTRIPTPHRFYIKRQFWVGKAYVGGAKGWVMWTWMVEIERVVIRVQY
ncbi:hypothetical protein DPMN_034060 [Dreissena polymorpha]|uniref:Uncharacterized protein n=1 Tax=Dreissena polymorpha TaxID=45954 RepID=A0A9D4RJQ7_DREPO|nr:hypothetical protein DPMN_034060 [Dreissena polymorpha]